MTRKILLLLLLLPAGLYCLNGLLSCTLTPYDAWVCKMDLYADGKTDKDTVDILPTRYLYFTAFPQTTCGRWSIPGVSTAYANKRCANWQNGIDSGSIRLSLNRPLICDSDTIAANTNLLSRPSFTRYTRFRKTSGDCSGIVYSLQCTDELLNATLRNTGYYTMYASCNTTNGQLLSDSLTVLWR
jgi:hypothetical protein